MLGGQGSNLRCAVHVRSPRKSLVGSGEVGWEIGEHESPKYPTKYSKHAVDGSIGEPKGPSLAFSGPQGG